VPADNSLLSSWAKSFRQHYCPDAEIDALIAGTSHSRTGYLTEIIFPDRHLAPGPSVRAGDFAELLVGDYLEFQLGYWVPRGKYSEKASRNESVKGVDIVGFKMNGMSHSPNDSLLAFEVKAQLTGDTCHGRLQNAIDDSAKDFYLRCAMTLNAIKRRLMRDGNESGVLMVQRFQNLSDHPYIYKSGAAALLSDGAYDPASLKTSVTTHHGNQPNLDLLVIRGSDLMSLAHALYKVAADEA
jgi:hypothetical protein